MLVVWTVLIVVVVSSSDFVKIGEEAVLFNVGNTDELLDIDEFKLGIVLILVFFI